MIQNETPMLLPLVEKAERLAEKADLDGRSKPVEEMVSAEAGRRSLDLSKTIVHCVCDLCGKLFNRERWQVIRTLRDKSQLRCGLYCRPIHQVEVLFASHIVLDASGCWIWDGGKGENGYGKFNYLGRTQTAHRFSYEWLVGDIPPGHIVCHRCDNPPCVNPNHLFAGVHKDNYRDMVEKGRASFTGHLRGEQHPRSVLSDKLVIQIRQEYADGFKQNQIARKHGVSTSLINFIVKNKIWKHLL